MQNKTNQGQNVVSLKHGSEMSDFCLKQGRGLMASAAHLNPKFPQLPPPYLPPRIEITKEYSCVQHQTWGKGDVKSYFTFWYFLNFSYWSDLICIDGEWRKVAVIFIFTVSFVICWSRISDYTGHDLRTGFQRKLSCKRLTGLTSFQVIN